MTIFGPPTPYDRSDILRKAETYRSSGRIRKAIREYEKVLAADPQDMEVHAKIAPLYIRTGRKVQAKASLGRSVAWYEKRGFVDKAIAMLRLALKLDRRDLAVRFHLVDLYLGENLIGSALRLLEGARRTFRGNRFLKKALAVEEKILSIAPDDFRAQVAMVRLLWRSGRRGDGLERLWQMESQWARRRNRKYWRKTRRLLCRYAPSLSTCWGCFVSLFTTPVPYGPGTKGRPAGGGEHSRSSPR